MTKRELLKIAEDEAQPLEVRLKCYRWVNYGRVVNGKLRLDRRAMRAQHLHGKVLPGLERYRQPVGFYKN